jgi:2-polyprenyl-6-hydroxyphenyl methylase / 3-demethylubiquinone-9 3-methyltransferase
LPIDKCEDAIKWTIYQKQHPEKTLVRYLAGLDNIYDKCRTEQTKKFIEQRIDLQNAEVLEVGCGGGIWTVYFAQRAKTLTVIDIHEHILEAAKLHVRENGLSAKVTFKAGDVYELCKDQHFDFIFLKDVLEHVPNDLEFLRKLALLLKATGKLYMSTQNMLSLNYLIEGGYERLRGNSNWCGWDPTHYRFYTKRNLSKLLEKVGFRPYAWHSMYHLPYRFLSRWFFGRVIERRIFHFVEWLGGDKPLINFTGWAIGVMADRS